MVVRISKSFRAGRLPSHAGKHLGEGKGGCTGRICTVFVSLAFGPVCLDVLKCLALLSCVLMSLLVHRLLVEPGRSSSSTSYSCSCSERYATRYPQGMMYAPCVQHVAFF